MNYIESEFYLNDTACEIIRKKTPSFGYNGFGEIVYYRSYSRTIRDDLDNVLGQEDWHDTVIRVINGVMSIRKDHYIRNRIHWDEIRWQKFAYQMAVSMFQMEWLPPGRGLWAMGTPLVAKRGAMALYNCAATMIGDDWIEDLCWLMDTLMFGVGVGFRPVRTGLTLQEPSGVITHSVEDTREGWVDALRLLLNAFQYGGKSPTFTYEKVRPFGSPIRTFGGTASGPEPLMKMLDTVNDLCYKYARNQLDEIQFKTDLANLCGVCVVAGNVRRSAEIALCEFDDPVFHDLKNYDKYPYRAEWGWMSNNSVLLTQDDDFCELDLIAQANINGHDVGYLNMRNVRYGRLGKRDNFPLDRAVGLNPCQPGWAWVLSEEGLIQFKDLETGSKIWSESGWTRVIKKVSTGVNDVYRFHTTAGTFYGTESHELVSEGFKCEARFCTDVDTLTGKQNTLLTHNTQFIKDGLVIGDGSFVGETRIVLNIGTKDQDYFDILDIGPQYNKQYQFQIITTVKAEELPHPALRRIPERFFRESYENRASFLQGLFSANGCVLKNRVALKTSSIGMVEDVQLMLSSVGIRSYYTTNKPTLVKHHNGNYVSKESYDVNVSNTLAFRQVIGGFLQRYKNERLESSIKSNPSLEKVTYDIVEKTLISTEETFDITVDNSSHTYWTGGLNVSNCGEIPLEHREVCNLAETLPTRCVDTERWLEACKFATFYCSTVTLLPTHQPSTNAIINRNRRIGVSLIDFTGWQDSIGTANVIAALRRGYNFIRETNKIFADEAGIPVSIRVTTVKPGGTVPKMAGRQSGAGYPTFRYTLRRINVGVGTPIDKCLIAAGVPFEDSAYTPNTHVFEYPIEQGPARPATEVTLWEQAMNLILLQREWADNAVSNTLYFKPKWSKIATDGRESNILGLKYSFNLDRQQVGLTGKECDYQVRVENGVLNLYRYNENHEEDQVADVLSHIAPLTKSVSLLPHSDVGIFRQMPEEGITKEEYEKRLSAIKSIDWSKFSNSDGQDEKYCEGDKCIIQQL